jgi:transposase
VQAKLHDVEMSMRGILRGFGLKVGATTPPRTFEGRVRVLVSGHATLMVVAEALLAARSILAKGVKAWRSACARWRRPMSG